jgi:hypothetical protein
MLAELSDHCETIEECYEFMLAYAAQGLPSDKGSQSGGQIRDYLGRAVRAISSVAEICRTASEPERRKPDDRGQAFFAVLERDAKDSLAALELVQAQPAISSQLIDNLNASIHLRALLTDLFLLSEVVKTQRTQAKSADFHG